MRIAAPKLGNVLLASTVSERLGLSLVVVYQYLQGTLHKRPFDGEVRRGDKVLIVDDVASDSQFLLQVIERLRLANAQILGVVVLVNRTEGDCAAVFNAMKVPFFSVLEISDATLARLLYGITRCRCHQSRPGRRCSEEVTFPGPTRDGRRSSRSAFTGRKQL